jgi:hypothetical protein
MSDLIVGVSGNGHDVDPAVDFVMNSRADATFVDGSSEPWQLGIGRLDLARKLGDRFNLGFEIRDALHDRNCVNFDALASVPLEFTLADLDPPPAEHAQLVGRQSFDKRGGKFLLSGKCLRLETHTNRIF